MKPTRNLVVFGATSAIAEAIMIEYAKNTSYQNQFYLIARNQSKLDQIIKDLTVRVATQVFNEIADLDHCEGHQPLIEKIQNQLDNNIHICIIAHGVLLDQENLNQNPDLAIKNFHTNAVSVISLMMRWANVFESQGFGKLAVIGSVAADLGRAKMTTYGAAKMAIERTAEALQSRFFASSISFTLIKPGYTKSPMTSNMKQAGFLWSTPEEIAPDIVQAIDKRKHKLYTPRKWLPIMMVLIHLPSYLIKKLDL